MVISSKLLPHLSNNQMTLANHAVGESIFIEIDGTPIEFIIVHQGNPNTNIYDSSCDGTWLMMKDLYTKEQWNDNLDNTYSSSLIHRYLNEELLPKINNNIQENILLIKVPYVNSSGYEGKLQQKDSGLFAKVFLLSGAEIGWNINDNENIFLDGSTLTYFNDDMAAEKRLALLNGEYTDWWLRTPDKNSNFSANRVLSQIIKKDNSINTENQPKEEGITFNLKKENNNNFDDIDNLINGLESSNFTVPLSTSEINTITGSLNIDNVEYSITNALTLIDANLALIECKSKYDLNEIEIFGILDGQNVSGFYEAYAKIYSMLLSLYKTKSDNSIVYYDISPNNSGSNDNYITTQCPANDTKLSTVLWKISGTVSLKGTKSISEIGRLIIIADDNATINMVTEKSQFLVSDSGVLSIQGPNIDKPITLMSPDVDKNINSLHIAGGSLYLEFCRIKDFKIKDTQAFWSVLSFPKGNVARYLYMDNTTFDNIRGAISETPCIMCQIYDEVDNSLCDLSRLYINNSIFTNCIVENGKKSTIGGAAIRSYAADRSQLFVKNTQFINNRVGNIATVENGSASGGGAIYWKSISGDAKASFVNCTFSNNHTSIAGGAILNMGNMELKQCYFKENTALGNGGAIAAETPYTTSEYNSIENNGQLSGALVLDNKTKIMNNHASQSGGGLYFNAKTGQIHSSNQIQTYTMTLTIDGTQITGNSADQNGGGIGIYLDYKNRHYKTGIIINEDSIIANNYAGLNGGAIWINGSDTCDCLENEGVLMHGGLLSFNQASNGGAIFIEAQKETALINYTIYGGEVSTNTSSNNGGAIFINRGNVTMFNGCIYDCTSLLNGGAIYLVHGNFQILGGQIYRCAANDGGAIYISNGNLNFLSGILANCEAIQEGGAIYITDGNAIIGIEDCENNHDHPQIENNFAHTGGGIYVTGGTVKFLCGNIISNTSTTAIKGDNVSIVGGSFEYNGGQIGDSEGLGIIINGGSMSDSRPNSASLDDSYYCTRKYGIRPILVLNKNTII